MKPITTIDVALVLFTVLFAIMVALGVLDEVLLWWRRCRTKRAADQARMRSSAKNYVERGGDLVTMEERLQHIRQTRPWL